MNSLWELFRKPLSSEADEVDAVEQLLLLLLLLLMQTTAVVVTEALYVALEAVGSFLRWGDVRWIRYDCCRNFWHVVRPTVMIRDAHERRPWNQHFWFNSWNSIPVENKIRTYRNKIQIISCFLDNLKLVNNVVCLAFCFSQYLILSQRPQKWSKYLKYSSRFVSLNSWHTL